MDPNKAPGIRIEQIFLERAEFSHRDDYLSLGPGTVLGNPTASLNFSSGLAPDRKRGLVRLQVSTEPDEKPLYNLNIVMVALFQVDESQENMGMDQYIRASGPALLYTFIRQMVADVTGRARFGPLWLNPVNFLAITKEQPRKVGEERIVFGTPTTRVVATPKKAKKRGKKSKKKR
jgi:hypothetical protein